MENLTFVRFDPRGETLGGFLFSRLALTFTYDSFKEWKRKREPSA